MGLSGKGGVLCASKVVALPQLCTACLPGGRGNYSQAFQSTVGIGWTKQADLSMLCKHQLLTESSRYLFDRSDHAMIWDVPLKEISMQSRCNDNYIRRPMLLFIITCQLTTTSCRAHHDTAFVLSEPMQYRMHLSESGPLMRVTAGPQSVSFASHHRHTCTSQGQ